MLLHETYIGQVRRNMNLDIVLLAISYRAHIAAMKFYTTSRGTARRSRYLVI